MTGRTCPGPASTPLGAAMPGMRVLIVDDEPLNLIIITGLLKRLGHEPVSADSGAKALELLDPTIAIVIMDVMMPDMDGFELTRRIRSMEGYSDIPILMATALSSLEDRIRAIEAGANDFIAKPIDATEFGARVGSLLRMRASQDAVKRHQGELEEVVRVRTQALTMAVDNLLGLQRAMSKAHRETILCLASAAEFRDQETSQHNLRIGEYCSFLAKNLGLPDGEVELFGTAAPLHDIGKIGIPDAILLKPGPLTPEEWEIMKMHTVFGSRILSSGFSEILETARVIALTHHERWDGTGYPNSIKGEEIPLMGRICAVADVFDALTSQRPYKRPYSTDEALAIMRKGRGSHFDPQILDLFLGRFDEIKTIQECFAD